MNYLLASSIILMNIYHRYILASLCSLMDILASATVSKEGEKYLIELKERCFSHLTCGNAVRILSLH